MSDLVTGFALKIGWFSCAHGSGSMADAVVGVEEIDDKNMYTCNRHKGQTHAQKAWCLR